MQIGLTLFRNALKTCIFLQMDLLHCNLSGLAALHVDNVSLYQLSGSMLVNAMPSTSQNCMAYVRRYMSVIYQNTRSLHVNMRNSTLIYRPSLLTENSISDEYQHIKR